MLLYIGGHTIIRLANTTSRCNEAVGRTWCDRNPLEKDRLLTQKIQKMVWHIKGVCNPLRVLLSLRKISGWLVGLKNICRRQTLRCVYSDLSD